MPKVTRTPVGTEVSFVQTEGFSKEEIITKIKNEYFWFLEVNKENQYKITIGGELITYEDYVEERIPFISNLNLDYTFDIKRIQWKQSLGNEYSKFYFLGSDGKEIYKEATKLNKKADEFYHSVIIKSSYFDTLYFEKEDNGQGDFSPSRNDEVYKKS